MKRFYLAIILLAAFCKTINAQNDSLERAFQKGYYTEYSCGTKDTITKDFYFGFNSSDSVGASYPPYIAKLDSNGNTVWESMAFLSNTGGGTVGKIIQCFDEDIVISGYEYVCDIWTGGSYVKKVSRLTGSTVWTKTFDLNSDFGKDIIQLPDSGFWLTNENMLYRLNSYGDSLTFNLYSYGNILKMVLTPSNNIILGCDSGLLKIDAAGNVLDSLPLPKSVSLLNNYRDSLYFAIAGKVIYKVDSMFNMVASDSSLFYAKEINAASISNNQLWVLNYTPSSQLSLLTKLDFNFVTLNQKTYSGFNGNDFDARDLFISNNSYYLIAHEATYSHSYHVALKNFTSITDSSYNYNTDVGVLNFYADTSYATLYTLAGITVVYPMFDIYVNVKNYGQAPISDVFLNLVIDTGIEWCKPFVFGNHFSGFSIQPGDSTNIHLGWVSQAPYSTLSNPSNQLDICIWTSSPNNRMDYNHYNDNNCQTFVLKNFVAINELESNDGITISPNPASTQLTINSKSKLIGSTIIITDVLGNRILEKKAETNSAFTIDVNNLPAALYFVSINGEGKRCIKKFIKM